MESPYRSSPGLPHRYLCSWDCIKLSVTIFIDCKNISQLRHYFLVLRLGWIWVMSMCWQPVSCKYILISILKEGQFVKVWSGVWWRARIRHTQSGPHQSIIITFHIAGPATAPAGREEATRYTLTVTARECPPTPASSPWRGGRAPSSPGPRSSTSVTT